MKLAPYILIPLSLFSVVAHPQKEKSRALFAPTHFYKAETYTELSDSNRELYTTGLMDGFYASAFFGATDETVNNLKACTKDMDSKQISAIILKYVKDHPETWHIPLSVEAYNALNTACPGGLRIVAPKP